MNKKKIIIICSIIVIAIITICILISNTIQPKSTSKELYLKVNKDFSEFGFTLSESMTGMSDIMTNDLDTILDEASNTIDLTKSKKYKDIKDNIDSSCDIVLNYNTTGFSKKTVDMIEYGKTVAKDTKETFNKMNKKMSFNEYDKIVKNFTGNFNEQMKELTRLLNIATDEFNENIK